MMTAIPFILLALLCCVMGCTATGLPEFRCMHDEMAKKNSGAMPATIVEPGPDKSGVQGAAKTAGDPEWTPIRIGVFSEDLNSASQYCTAEGQIRPSFEGPSKTANCTAVDILTGDKKSHLLTVMIPLALKLHSDRLLVQPLPGNIGVPKYTTGTCSTFTIPQTHHTTGVADADTVMYVAAGPTGSDRAWADLCSFAPNGRPVVGVMNVGPAMISSRDQSIRVVAHEIAHSLGFAYDVMNKLKMVKSIANIRGRSRLVVSSALTLSKAKAHYNCSSIAGMELENEGGNGTARSHWERRNARDELMAGFESAGYYSALTMAAFEDQGYYRANWGMEETMEWGRNTGCPFLEEKCVNNGRTMYPEMFCTEKTPGPVCTFARKGLGECTIHKYSDSLPVEFQYFADPTMGGSDRLFDFCPIVYQYSNSGCTDGNPHFMPGSRVGPNSVCLKGEGLRVKGYGVKTVQDICAEVSCKNNIVRVRYLGDDAWYPCPEGSTITPKGSLTTGKIVCPGHAEVCRTNSQPNDSGINETIDNKFDTETTTAIPSPTDDSLSKRHGSTNDGKGDASSTTTPSAVESSGEKGSSGTVNAGVRQSSENGDGSASTGAPETVKSTDSIVDASQHPNHWYGSFIPLGGAFVHLYILMLIFGIYL